MTHDIQQPTLDKYGAETHPAFAVAVLHNSISANPGSVLFDSEIRHRHPISLTIHRATRSRDLNQDWIHQESTPLIEIEMSPAQWAALISSGGQGGGVPVTLRQTENERDVPGLPYEPRLGLSVEETKEAARKAAERIQAAYDALEALDPAKDVKARRAAMRNLKHAIDGLPHNVEYASKSLVEHVENTVTKAKADIEAMVVQHAERIGLDPADVGAVLELESGDAQ